MDTSPEKTHPKEEDEVIIYMDELPRNGRATLATADTFDYTADPEESIVPEKIVDLDAKPARLLETDNTNNPRPSHGPEIDDLEPEDRVKHDFYPGIDDGLLEPDDDDRHAMVNFCFYLSVYCKLS